MHSSKCSQKGWHQCHLRYNYKTHEVVTHVYMSEWTSNFVYC